RGPTRGGRERRCAASCLPFVDRFGQVDAAFQLVGIGPAAGPLLLVGRRRPCARDAADRTVAAVVQGVVRDLVDDDVCPDALLVPVGERVDLEDAVAV